jgi:hypothetical protein
VLGAHRGACRRENTRAAEHEEYRSSPRGLLTLRPPGGDRPREVVDPKAAPRAGSPCEHPCAPSHYPLALPFGSVCARLHAPYACAVCARPVPEMC